MTERRGFLKSLMAGTVASGLPPVKTVEILQANPEDTVILSVDEHVSAETAARLKRVFDQETGLKCLVLGKGLSVKVLRG